MRDASVTNSQILDKPNAAMDRQLARHLVSLYYKVPVVPASPLAQDFLMDYIAYARRYIQPEVRFRHTQTHTGSNTGRLTLRMFVSLNGWALVWLPRPAAGGTVWINSFELPPLPPARNFERENP